MSADYAPPLYEGGERCGLHNEVTLTTGAQVETECVCSRLPHDDGRHRCPCGMTWQTNGSSERSS